MENSNTNMSQKTVMGILAYIGPLVIISYVMAKADPFVKFHIKQGLVLLVIEVAAWFIGMTFWPLWFVINLLNFATLVLSIIGIINVLKNKQNNLPLVGTYSRYFNI